MENDLDILDENYDFEEEFRKIRMNFREKIKNKERINRNEEIELDTKYLEVNEALESEYRNKKIEEEEYIQIIKNSDKFFFDDYKKLDEEDLMSLKEKKEERPNFEIICYFHFHYYRKKGIFEDYDKNTKMLTLKNKIENQQVINTEHYYLYGKIKEYGKKDDFRKNMELILKCSSMVVKRKKNDENKNNEKLIQELNDSDEEE